MAKDLTLKINADTTAVQALLGEIMALETFESLKEGLGLLFSLPDTFEKLFLLESDIPFTPGASEMCVRANPTDFARRLVAACRAGNIDGLLVVHGLTPP